MAGHTYVTKAYNNKADFPAQGGYAYVPEPHVNWYLVETRTVERVRVPASGYAQFSGAPLKNELLYDSDYANSSPSNYHDRENLMANFLNELHIGARPPVKSGNLSSPNKYRPTSPPKYHPKSPEKYRPTSPNKYYPTSPVKYRPNKYESTSPNKYRPNSPDKYRSKSPNKYRPTSPNKYYPTSPVKYRPNKYESTSPNKYRPNSPDKYRSKSPNKYRPTNPNKYLPSSPDKFQSTSPSKYWPTSSPYTYPSKEANMKAQTMPGPNKYLPSSPEKYQSTSPSKYRPTNSPYTYPSKEANTKAQTLPGPKKYQPTSPTKYLPASPTHNYPPEEDHMNRPQNIHGPNKYRATSPVHRIPIKEGQPIRTQGLSGPNKNLGVGGGGRLVDVSSPNYNWQSAGPPTTRHPLTTPTNNIDEALGFLIESYSPQAHLTREGPFDNLSPRAQPNARATSEGVTNRPYLRSNAIDSHEAVRRYNGAYVP